ncbi:MAG: hypothetical protein IKZ43_10665 [Acidaminococcaceae bacterium]|nr:hypothetical protein [Acidaminococcaceae bacterium]
MNIREAAIAQGKEIAWGAEREQLQQKENAVTDKYTEINLTLVKKPDAC